MYEFQRSQQERRVAGGGWMPTASPPPPSRSLGSTSRPIPRLRTVLADPDPVARQRLRALLAEASDIRLVGESESGRGTLDLIHREAPDLVFLDVQLPDLDGFQVARSLNGELSGGLIFVTDRDEYAFRAFEIHALDYLLKPVYRDRLQAAVAHARSILRGRRDSATQDRLIALLDRRDAERQRRARLLIRRAEGAFFLKTESIDWIEAAGKRVRVHTGSRCLSSEQLWYGWSKGSTPTSSFASAGPPS